MERVRNNAEISSTAKLHIIYGSVIMLLCLSFAITTFTMNNHIAELKKKTSVSQLPEGHPDVNSTGQMQGEEQMPGGATGAEPPNVQKMVGELKVALAKDPNDIKALTGMGNLYFDSGQYIKAIEFYEKAYAIDSKNSLLVSDLATCYFYTNSNDKAIKTFKIAIELDPQNVNARYNLGIVYKTLGKIPDARKEWEDMKKYLKSDEEKKKLESVIESLGKS